MKIAQVAPLYEAVPTSYLLKDGDSFVVANASGDVDGGSDGYFRHDTRLLSRLVLSLGETQPVLLSTSVSRDNVRFVAHLTNRPLPPLGASAPQEGVIHLQRDRLLHEGRLFERITCRNYGREPVRVALRLSYAADFRNMFEIRGGVRNAHGSLLATEVSGHAVVFSYRGLDEAVRLAVLSFSPTPALLTHEMADILLDLLPGVPEAIYLECGALSGPAPSAERFRDAAVRARLGMRRQQRRSSAIRSDAPQFDAWMERSRADLALLTTELETGPYPYAGIPWNSTPFGRDAVIAALQTLWLAPQLARGVLAFLAQHQAMEESAFLDPTRVKIMPETGKGELATSGELPFGRYYAGVDTAPLFVTLAGAYVVRTSEVEFIDRLWPALIAATTWIERVCDANPSGLLDYQRGSSSRLANQGWKDSEDSVFHSDGQIPPGPIALIEVQGYVYAAFRAMARLARLRNEPSAAQHWAHRAERIRATVEDLFWMEDEHYYGLALDGESRLCRVQASNPGHLLFTGLPSPERAQRVCARLLDPAFDTGWGLRTLALGEARFNPMSHHNGSVWPHDTALCAAGMARYGERAGAAQLLRGLFDAALHFDLRLPALFCGFARTHSSTPVAYPVACLPQAWAAGSAFMLLQASLGLRIDGARAAIRVERPWLPPGVDQLHVRRIEIGGRRVDLALRQRDGQVEVGLEGRDANVVMLEAMV